MTAAAHFMHHSYGPFDARLNIAPPSTERKRQAHPPTAARPSMARLAVRHGHHVGLGEAQQPLAAESRPIPLWLNPPNGARSSTAVALWLLKNVTPLRSRLPTAIACSSSEDHTDEHRPAQVSLAIATACPRCRMGSPGGWAELLLGDDPQIARWLEHQRRKRIIAVSRARVDVLADSITSAPAARAS